MTDEQRISLVRDRIDLLRKTEPQRIKRILSNEKLLSPPVEVVIPKTEKEALEWVLRELFEVTP